MHTSQNSAPRGFTLVELLVVIAIIALLIALLVPAVQSSREVARRIQYQNNMKQLGIALHAYHTSNNAFPPAITTQPGGNPVAYSNQLRPGWTIMVLPYLEQQTLYDAFDLTQPVAHDFNRLPRSTRVSVMSCPSEPNASQACSRAGGEWARGNYGANIGMLNPGDTLRNGSTRDLWRPTQRGIMGANEALTIAQIRDGTSNTMLVLELRAGLVPLDIRGTWAMGQCGASSVCSYGNNVQPAIPGPNICKPDADDQPEGETVVSVAIGIDRAKRECMHADNSPTWQSFPRSSHIGGIVVGFADGSVHFIGDYVESGSVTCGPRDTCNVNQYRTWQHLIASGDGQPVDLSAF